MLIIILTNICVPITKLLVLSQQYVSNSKSLYYKYTYILSIELAVKYSVP